MKAGRLVLVIFALALATNALLTGCSTRSARARSEAFRAGQQQAQMEARARQNGIAFSGPVLNPIVPWTPGMTLAQAITLARWAGRDDPRFIIVSRGSERVEMTPAQALAAAGFALEPGDSVELVP